MATPPVDPTLLDREGLLALVRAQGVELEHVRTALVKSAFDPSVFMNSGVRDVFWNRVNTCEGYSHDKYTILQKIQEDGQRQILAIGERDQRIEELGREVEGLREARDRAEKRAERVEILEQKVKEMEGEREYLHGQNHYLARMNSILSEKVGEYEGRVDRLEQQYRQAREECLEEKARLRERIKGISPVAAVPPKSILSTLSEYRQTEGTGGDKTDSMEGIYLRLSTVSSDSVKYLSLLSVLSTMPREVSTGEGMGKIYLKGILSPDKNISTGTIDYVLSLGQEYIIKNIHVFQCAEVGNKICKEMREAGTGVLPMRDERTGKYPLSSLLSLTSILLSSPTFSQSFTVLGGMQYLIALILPCTSPLYINSEYMHTLLRIMRIEMIEGSVLTDPGLSPTLVKFLVSMLTECLNKDSLVQVLQILDRLPTHPAHRSLLMQLSIFNRVIALYLYAWEYKDHRLLFPIYALMSRFMSEHTFRQQLLAHFSLHNDLPSLLEVFKEEHSHIVTGEIKVCTLIIIRAMLESEGIGETIVVSGFLRSVLHGSLGSGEEEVRSLSLDCLILARRYVVSEQLRIDDMMVKAEGLYAGEEKVREKSVLLLAWSLSHGCLPQSVLTLSFLSSLLKGSLSSLQSAHTGLYRKEYSLIYLMMDKQTEWKEYILNQRYLESLITARPPAHPPTVKAWLLSLCLFLHFKDVLEMFKSNPVYLKYLGVEITDSIRSHPLESILLSRSCMSLEAMRPKLLDPALTTITVSKLAEIDPSIPSDSLLLGCYQYLHFLSTTPAGKNVIAQCRALHPVLAARAQKLGSLIQPLIISIVGNVTRSGTVPGLDTILADRETPFDFPPLPPLSAYSPLSLFCTDMLEQMMDRYSIDYIQ